MYTIDRRYFRYFDWISCGIMLMLSLIGLLFVMSATYQPAQPFSLFCKKQAAGIISGIILYFIMSALDYRKLQRWGFIAYIITIGLLIFTIIKGSVGLGAQRWISIGIIKFQPSELTKLFFPAFFVTLLGIDEHRFPRFSDFIPVLTIVALSFLLILKQPDLGTALIVSSCALCLSWFANIGSRFFIILISCVVITAPLSWQFLKPYQKKRIAVFLGEGDSRRERYQIEQSCIAIGSGGIYGKGFLRGTQNQLQFLPESRTDFIFAVIAEELGFIGAFMIILLYILLFARFLAIIRSLVDPATQLLAIGLIIHIVLSAIVNIGMVSGLLPIVGIPLPFLSYGITHSWITFASLGWFNSIAMRRFYKNKL